jgi:transcriptional regulator with XRE-family HTH domain
MTLGKRIKATRIEKGYTQKELAVFAGILQKNLSTYENDLVMPSADTLHKISIALKTSMDYLLGSPFVELNNPEFTKMLNDIDKLPKKEKEALLTIVQTYLNAYKKSKNK